MQVSITVAAIDAQASTLPRILVVDDTPAMLVATRQMTKAIRVSIDEMKSGEEFLEYAQSDLAGSQYDIVILDNNMGGMDGIEALETAKSAGFQGRVIINSADSDPEKVERFKASADYYFPKNRMSKSTFLVAFQQLGWCLE